MNRITQNLVDKLQWFLYFVIYRFGFYKLKMNKWYQFEGLKYKNLVDEGFNRKSEYCSKKQTLKKPKEYNPNKYVWTDSNDISCNMNTKKTDLENKAHPFLLGASSLFQELYGSPVQMNDRFESVHIWSEELAIINKGRWTPQLITIIKYEAEQNALNKGAVSGSFFPFAIYETELKKITQIHKTKASLMIQLSILKDFANKLGLYDAADFLKNDRQRKIINAER